MTGDKAPDTLWTRTARLPAESDAVLPQTVDVAVIGGGFTGMTAARDLLIAGRSVAVLEAGEIGAGASGMNAGFVVPNFAKADPNAVRARLGTERGNALLRLVGDGAEHGIGAIAELFDSKKLVPQVGTVLPLADAQVAHQMLAGAPHGRGKSVLSVAA